MHIQSYFIERTTEHRFEIINKHLPNLIFNLGGISLSSECENTPEYAYDVIDPVGLGLIIPIYNTSMIPTILDPHIVKVHTQFTVAEGEQYADNLDYATGTFPFPGFTFWITLSGLSLIIMIGLVMNKKKN